MSSQGFKLLEVAEAKGAVGVCVFVHVPMCTHGLFLPLWYKGYWGGGGEARFDCLAPDLLTQIPPL